MYIFDTLHKNPVKLHSEPDHMVAWMAQNAKEKTLENRIFDGQNHIVVFD